MRKMRNRMGIENIHVCGRVGGVKFEILEKLVRKFSMKM